MKLRHFARHSRVQSQGASQNNRKKAKLFGFELCERYFRQLISSKNRMKLCTTTNRTKITFSVYRPLDRPISFERPHFFSSFTLLLRFKSCTVKFLSRNGSISSIMSIRDASTISIPPITIMHPCNQFSITITIICIIDHKLQIFTITIETSSVLLYTTIE